MGDGASGAGDSKAAEKPPSSSTSMLCDSCGISSMPAFNPGGMEPSGIPVIFSTSPSPLPGYQPPLVVGILNSQVG